METNGITTRNLYVSDFLNYEQLNMLFNHEWDFNLDCKNFCYHEKNERLGTVLLGPMWRGLKNYTWAFDIIAPVSGYYVLNYYKFRMTTLDDKHIMDNHIDYLHVNINALPSACFVFDTTEKDNTLFKKLISKRSDKDNFLYMSRDKSGSISIYNCKENFIQHSNPIIRKGIERDAKKYEEEKFKQEMDAKIETLSHAFNIGFYAGLAKTFTSLFKTKR